MNKTVFNNVKKNVLDKINELASNNTIILGENCIDTINKTSTMIATQGRIGEATNMIISKENYDKYHISEISDKYEILFEDVDDIYIYRKNSFEQPGLCLCYYVDDNTTYYEVVSIGFCPEKQFIKIKVVDHEQ